MAYLLIKVYHFLILLPNTVLIIHIASVQLLYTHWYFVARDTRHQRFRWIGLFNYAKMSKLQMWRRTGGWSRTFNFLSRGVFNFYKIFDDVAFTTSAITKELMHVKKLSLFWKHLHKHFLFDKCLHYIIESVERFIQFI